MPTGSISDRARSSAAVDGQDGLFDRVIDDAGLASVLEEREEKRLARLTAIADFKLKNDEAKALIAALGMEPGDVVRVGRFRLKLSRSEARSVAFDTSPSDRLFINAIDD